MQHNVAILKIVLGGQILRGEGGAEKASQDIGDMAWKEEAADQVFGMVAS